MYARLFYHLPGPRPVKWLITLVLVAGAVYGLFEYGFPALAPYMPFQIDPTA